DYYCQSEDSSGYSVLF
nr:immunoglobulin light chain junction region [Macaca mulatta]